MTDHWEYFEFSNNVCLSTMHTVCPVASPILLAVSSVCPSHIVKKSLSCDWMIILSISVVEDNDVNIS